MFRNSPLFEGGISATHYNEIFLELMLMEQRLSLFISFILQLWILYFIGVTKYFIEISIYKRDESELGRHF